MVRETEIPVRLTYAEYFSNERQLRTFCEDVVGLSPKRAKIVAEQLAEHPLPRATAAKILVRLLADAWQRRDHAQVERAKDLILRYSRSTPDA
jgi:hypothetical protein